MHRQFLLLVELLGVAHRLELDLVALHPADRDAGRAGAGGQFVAQVHRGRFETLGRRDGGRQLKNVLIGGAIVAICSAGGFSVKSSK